MFRRRPAVAAAVAAAVALSAAAAAALVAGGGCEERETPQFVPDESRVRPAATAPAADGATTRPPPADVARRLEGPATPLPLIAAPLVVQAPPTWRVTNDGRTTTLRGLTPGSLDVDDELDVLVSRVEIDPANPIKPETFDLMLKSYRDADASDPNLTVRTFERPGGVMVVESVKFEPASTTGPVASTRPTEASYFVQVHYYVPAPTSPNRDHFVFSLPPLSEARFASDAEFLRKMFDSAEPERK